MAKQPERASTTGYLQTAPAALSSTPEASAQASARVGDGGRVLVAEDNEINQIAASRLLQKLGFSVDVVRNGREAIEAIETSETSETSEASGREGYAAVFMDCQMAEMDGYAATKVIRRREAERCCEGDRRRTPIIAVTAHTLAGDLGKCIAAGMDDHIAKPLRVADVERVLSRVLSDNDAAPGLEFHGSGVAGAEVESTGGNGQPLIDLDVVEEILCDGGAEAGLLDLFIGQSHARLRDLAKAVDERDAAGAARIAHSLKGSCATFGAIKLANAAARLSYDDPRALLSEAEALHAELVAILAATEVVLAQFGAGLGVKSARLTGTGVRSTILQPRSVQKP